AVVHANSDHVLDCVGLAPAYLLLDLMADDAAEHGAANRGRGVAAAAADLITEHAACDRAADRADTRTAALIGAHRFHRFHIAIAYNFLMGRVGVCRAPRVRGLVRIG